MFIVDCQTHVFPRAYAELLLRAKGWVRAKKQNDAYVVSYGELQSFRFEPEVYEPDSKLHAMDDSGIDMAEQCARYPHRFVGLAVIPWYNAEVACAELERAVNELGLRGVILYSHINGRPVDSPEFEPIYDMAEKMGIPLVVHPTVPTWGEVLKDYSMIPMVGLMVDTSIAVLRLILSGLLERHPGLMVVHPHCGGVLPYLMPRIMEQTEVKKRGREHIEKSPEDYYTRLYLDIVSPSLQAMHYAYEFIGPDKLLFASDHPWVSYGAILGCIDRMAIAESDKRKILGENARELFKIC